MKKTKLIICLMLALVMLVGALPAFATEGQTDATTPTEVTEGTEASIETTEAETEPVEEKQEEVLDSAAPTVTTGAAEEEKKDENATPALAGKPSDKCSSPKSKNGTHSQIVGSKSKFNATHHWYTCTYCGELVGEEHTFGEWKQVSLDSVDKETGEEIVGVHSPYCKVCQKQYDKQEHNYPEEYDANEKKTCADCGNVKERPHQHIYSAEWSSNAYQHWHACEATFGLKGTKFCKFDGLHKQVCTPEQHLAKDENGHDAFRRNKGVCAECGITQAAFDETITEHAFDENGYCAYCQTQIENITDWGEHTFDENGICTVCGAKDVIPEERPGDAGVKWIVIAIIGVVGAGSAAAVFLLDKKKKK